MPNSSEIQKGAGASVSWISFCRRRRPITSTALMAAMINAATMPVSVIVVVRLALSNTGRRSASQIITTSVPSRFGSHCKRVAAALLMGGKRHEGRRRDSSALPRPETKPPKQTVATRVASNDTVLSDSCESQSRPVWISKAMMPGVATDNITCATARNERRSRPGGTRVAVRRRISRPIQMRSAMVSAAAPASNSQPHFGVWTTAVARSSPKASRRWRSRGNSS
ncbi:hypothetical protein D3C87_1497130 [compost metagenome]